MDVRTGDIYTDDEVGRLDKGLTERDLKYLKQMDRLPRIVHQLK